MNLLDRTLEGVTDGRHLQPSLGRLLHNIAAQIRITAGSADATLGYADMLDRETDNLAGHVLANTPMIMATPPYHPEPGASEAYADKLDTVSTTGTPEEIDGWIGDHPGMKEVHRDEHADGTVTAYFMPDKDAAEKPVAKVS